MPGLLSALFGGNKSEKDVKAIRHYVGKINTFFDQFNTLSNDELRNKTVEFRGRIKDHIKDIDDQIDSLNNQADTLDSADISGRDALYQQVDALKKDRDKKLE